MGRHGLPPSHNLTQSHFACRRAHISSGFYSLWDLLASLLRHIRCILGISNWILSHVKALTLLATFGNHKVKWFEWDIDEMSDHELKENWEKSESDIMWSILVSLIMHKLKVTWATWAAWAIWAKWHEERGMRSFLLSWLLHCLLSSTEATIPTNLYWNSTNPIFNQVLLTLANKFVHYFVELNHPSSPGTWLDLW